MLFNVCPWQLAQHQEGGEGASADLSTLAVLPLDMRGLLCVGAQRRGTHVGPSRHHPDSERLVPVASH